MGKRIMFRDADFSDNGLKPFVDQNWAFGLAYLNLDAAESVVLNFEGIAVYDIINCKNSELTQQHITKIRFDAEEEGVFQILKVNIDDYTNYEVIQEIDCVAGISQEVEVDIRVGRNYYLGVKNVHISGRGKPLYYFNEIGDYGAGMRFSMLDDSGKTYNFPNSVVRIDFFSETEKYE